MGEDSTFDLAVLDVKLGGRDGGNDGGSMTVAALLSEQGTPFIFLTGVHADSIQAGPFAGAPVVEKPYQAPLLIEAVRRVLTART